MDNFSSCIYIGTTTVFMKVYFSLDFSNSFCNALVLPKYKELRVQFCYYLAKWIQLNFLKICTDINKLYDFVYKR